MLKAITKMPSNSRSRFLRNNRSTNSRSATENSTLNGMYSSRKSGPVREMAGCRDKPAIAPSSVMIISGDVVRPRTASIVNKVSLSIGNACSLLKSKARPALKVNSGTNCQNTNIPSKPAGTHCWICTQVALGSE